MPFIRIESLPFAQPLDLAEVIRAINRELAEATGIPLNHLHTGWQYLPKGCYAKGDTTPQYQPELGHPLIVELLTPDNLETAVITKMFESVAETISRYASFPRQNIFIYHRVAHSGAVFDDGRVATW
ncbi:MAG: hypothetical protein C0624_06190 [Desulfuromonas sp.]|nr:MAG: hypothetical protein C0624_06190 [Desulfuromonas sp.]